MLKKQLLIILETASCLLTIYYPLGIIGLVAGRETLGILLLSIAIVLTIVIGILFGTAHKNLERFPVLISASSVRPPLDAIIFKLIIIVSLAILSWNTFTSAGSDIFLVISSAIFAVALIIEGKWVPLVIYLFGYKLYYINLDPNNTFLLVTRRRIEDIPKIKQIAMLSSTVIYDVE